MKQRKLAIYETSIFCPNCRKEVKIEVNEIEGKLLLKEVNNATDKTIRHPE